VILSAGYALWLYRRVTLGALVKDSLRGITDMNAREKAIFAPLVVMTILLGVYPSLITDIVGPSVAAMLEPVQEAQAGFGPATVDLAQIEEGTH
jgi:NADH-quinone oxidoreductase subunit M